MQCMTGRCKIQLINGTCLAQPIGYKGISTVTLVQLNMNEVSLNLARAL